MTVEELLLEPLRIHKIVEEEKMHSEVERLLALVGLKHSEKDKISKPIKWWTKSAGNHCSGNSNPSKKLLYVMSRCQL